MGALSGAAVPACACEAMLPLLGYVLSGGCGEVWRGVARRGERSGRRVRWHSCQPTGAGGRELIEAFGVRSLEQGVCAIWATHGPRVGTFRCERRWEYGCATPSVTSIHSTPGLQPACRCATPLAGAAAAFLAGHGSLQHAPHPPLLRNHAQESRHLTRPHHTAPAPHFPASPAGGCAATREGRKCVSRKCGGCGRGVTA